jgi:succinyl-diaminopimelate desuccinylase
VRFSSLLRGEIGCEGAFHLARAGILGRAGAIVVAEPTSNAALVGHKGALWLRLTLKGVTAHGSMPHLGVNAAFKAARVLTALETFQFNVAPHPYLGSPTLNVGTVRAGLNVNSVPDFAEIGIDIRSIPGLDHSRIQEHLKAELGMTFRWSRLSMSMLFGPIPLPRGSRRYMGSSATSLGKTPTPSPRTAPFPPTRPP